MLRYNIEPMNPLTTVREAVIRAVPEIQIWACEGCNTVYAEYVNGCPKCWDENLSVEENRKKYPKRGVDAKYRNIHLDDVLRAVPGNRLGLQKSSRAGSFAWFLKFNDELHRIATEATGIPWDLTQPLEGQSQECLEFLAKLLTS